MNVEAPGNGVRIPSRRVRRGGIRPARRFFHLKPFTRKSDQKNG
jgi:hypothetical protein